MGETKKKILTRTLEHQKDALEGNWNKTGVTEHTKECHGRFNWINPTTLQKEPRYFHRKISESLEIQCMKVGPNEVAGTNRDGGINLTSQCWRGFYHEWREKQPHLKRWKSYWEKSDDDVIMEDNTMLTSSNNDEIVDGNIT